MERLLAAHAPPLTLAQYDVLQTLAEGQVLGADLARRAAVSPAAISQLLDALVQAGFVERLTMPEDRRRQALRVTEEGLRSLRSAQAVIVQHLAAVLGSLPPHEASALLTSLGHVAAALSGTAPPPRPQRHPPPPRPPR
jgi:DNA-binding MarR family transcriptional regulator